MNKHEITRASLIYLLIFLMAGIAYAAVPQSTIRTDAGITTYVGQYGNFTLGWYQGAVERVSATGAATFITLDTGHGVNELYAMNQDVETTDDVTFVNITATNGITLGGVTNTVWPAGGGGGSGVITASDILFETGGLYYSVDGSTGANYSDANPTNIILWTIGNASAGDLIHFKPANWTIYSKITVNKEGLTIEGEGQGSFFYAANGLNDDMFLVTVNYVTFRHISFDGNKANNNAGSVIELQPGTAYFEYDNNYMINAAAHPLNIAGTDLAPSQYAFIHDSLFEYCGDAKIVGQQRVVNIYKSDYCQVFDNTFLYSSNQSVFVNDGFKNSISRNTVKFFYYEDSPAIELYEANDTLIQDNILVHGLAEGISVWTSAYTIVTGNYIGDIGNSSTLQQAIILNQNSTYNIVSDNVINGTYGIGAGGNGHGIYVFECSYNIISDNILVNIGDSPICTQGAGAIYSSYNEIYGNIIGPGYQRYGLELATGSQYTDISKGNQIAASGFGRLNPVGSTSTTIFSSILVPFTWGTDEVSSVGSPLPGYKIDDVLDNATAYFVIPETAYNSIRFTLYGINLAFEADGVCVNITIYGGTGNQPILTSETSIVGKEVSLETGAAGNDVISWTFSYADDGDIDEYTPDDLGVFIVQYSPASGANGPTNCKFGAVKIEYLSR